MTWFWAELLKGEKYPEEVYWPDGIDAFIPLSEAIIKQPPITPGKKSVQLFWRKFNSDSLHPFVWINDKGEQESSIDIKFWISTLKRESYCLEQKPPVMARLPFHYHSIPGSVRTFVAATMFKARSIFHFGKAGFSNSFLNCGAEILLGVCNARWDLGISLPVLVLTHDIDSANGFRWVDKISRIEEKYGVRSLWNVVPKYYDVQKDILHSLLEKGHEIGLHGIWHNNKESFLPEEGLRKELNSLKNFMDEFSIKGYRSPCWYRTSTMFKVLSEFFSYDLSCIDNDLMTDKGGVGFMRPFRMDCGLIQLPCTLLPEAQLFEKTDSASCVEYWMPKINFIKASNGMILLNTHPDPYYSGNNHMLAQYNELLKTLVDQKWEAKLPVEIVKEISC